MTGTVLSFTGSGQVFVTAHQPGDSQWAPAPDVQQIINALPIDQIITFGNPGDQPWPTVLDLAASSTSGLPVSFTVDAGPASITGTQATFSDTGSVTITAHQAGDANYNPAPDVPQTFNSLSIDQTINFADPGNQVWCIPLDLVATATSGLAVSFTVDSGPATIIGGQAVFSGLGSVTITAHQAGDSKYNVAPDVSHTFNVIPIPATFDNPNDLVVDSAGNIFIADSNNHTIRKITPAGAVTTFAGLAGAPGSANGTGATARFHIPNGICVDGADNLYIADTYNHTIRKITPAAVVTTVAGLAGNNGHTDGNGSAARFNYPRGVASATTGILYVADTNNNTIRKITTAGDVTTFAGVALNSGWADGTGSGARFNSPFGICMDGGNGLYVADTGNFTIRHVTSGAVVTTYAGLHNTHGSTDGVGPLARFYFVYHLSIDTGGNVFVCDSGATIRKIAPGGGVMTFAGTYNSQGTADGYGSAARFNFGPTVGGGTGGCYNDTAGNLYVADTGNFTIRKITPFADVTTIAGQAGINGHADYP